MADRPGPEELLTLRSDQLAVDLLPGKGADLCSLVHRDTGVDVLWRTPWGWRDPHGLPWTGDSQIDFLARYPGGWQQLVPNAGPPREQDGVQLSYHGEAAVVPWQVLERDDAHALLEVHLLTAPLHLTRHVTLVGARLLLRDEIVNESPDPVEVRWVQHPGFGAPFIDGAARIHTGARLFVTDADAPGAQLPGDAIQEWPLVADVHGNQVDLQMVPDVVDQRAVFGALTDFDAAWCAITSPTTGLRLRMEWDPTVFPHAWFWQECHGSPGFPWFRRAYVVAVEPANVLPGEGTVGALRRGSGPVLAGGQRLTSEISVTLERI